jgi:hypothetical protein
MIFLNRKTKHKQKLKRYERNGQHQNGIPFDFE